MKRILLQLDTDSLASSFDAITALDAGVDHLLSYSHVNTSNIVPLVQGAIFTRGQRDLSHTAVFIGGSDVEMGEALLKKVRDSFFGPMRVSVMMDSNGCNTTAAAAVICAGKHLNLSQARALVLGGTGPVGRRVAAILASLGTQVTVVSRDLTKARKICSQMEGAPPTNLTPAKLVSAEEIDSLLEDQTLVIAAGAAGVEFCSLEQIQAHDSIQLAIDLNAVPPLGIHGIESSDKARKVGSLCCYGAVGVGGLKMKIHHHLIEQLFQTNDHVLEASQIYQMGLTLEHR